MAPENPAAFPCTGEGFNSPHYTQHGMTLRDWFAGQALAGLCVTYSDGESYKHVSETAYRQADAMLRARSAEFGNIGADGVQS